MMNRNIFILLALVLPLVMATLVSPDAGNEFDSGLLSFQFASDSPADYLPFIKALANYFLKNKGEPPNAVSETEIEGRKTFGAYHVYQDDATHLQNGGATTSETQVLFLNFMTLYAALTGEQQGMWGAYSYLRYYMMPHDGWESPELPDSKLVNRGDAKYMPPRLTHWLIDVSGKSRSGDAIFGTNTLYQIYGGPPMKCLEQKGNDQRYRFDSALDADQWLAEGLYWASAVYHLQDFSKDLLALRTSLKDCLVSVNKKRIMPFSRHWGANRVGNYGWKYTLEQFYTGYQDAATWYILEEPQIAQEIVAFLATAQTEYQKRYSILGPFMPVYEKGAFTWKGYDVNTHWMGFQYRTFAHLTHYYYLSGNATALPIIENFYRWVKKQWRNQGGRITIPTLLHKETESSANRLAGQVQEMGYSVNNHALMAQGLIYLAAKLKQSKYQTDAEALLNDLVHHRRNQLGAYPEPGGNIYGFHNAEVGIALCLYELLIGGRGHLH